MSKIIQINRNWLDSCHKSSSCKSLAGLRAVPGEWVQMVKDAYRNTPEGYARLKLYIRRLKVVYTLCFKLTPGIKENSGKGRLSNYTHVETQSCLGSFDPFAHPEEVLLMLSLFTFTYIKKWRTYWFIISWHGLQYSKFCRRYTITFRERVYLEYI